MENSQRARGDQNVQISQVAAGATITVSVNGGRARHLPLAPAYLPLSPNVAYPSRLLRASAALIPWTGRTGVLDQLVEWATNGEAFALMIVGGRGGVGKTRLAVELCRNVSAIEGWLCGMLKSSTELAQLEALADTPTSRLVVVDYAENRSAQLELLLPMLASAATADSPVRVLLLIRAQPPNFTDWSSPLRSRGDVFDGVLDLAKQLVLQDVPFDLPEREQLFAATAATLSERLNLVVGSASAAEADELDSPAFETPLMVSIAAYLRIHGDATAGLSRTELFQALIEHEDRYWRSTSSGLNLDSTIRRRIVALATLAAADTESEAAELLKVLPDLVDSSAERRHQLARWAERLYPGQGWWNSVEPDVLGEYLVAMCFADAPEVLVGCMHRESFSALSQTLQMLARSASDYPNLKRTLSLVLSREAPALSANAAAQAAGAPTLDLLLDGPTIADALGRIVSLVPLQPESLSRAYESLPRSRDIILSPLKLTFASQLVQHYRLLAAADPSSKPELASWLNNYSTRLSEVGRQKEALAPIEESVALYQTLSECDPIAHKPGLSSSLMNFSSHLAELGRHEAALIQIQKAVRLQKELAENDSMAHKPDLARSLRNLSACLMALSRPEEALAPLQESVALRRELAATTNRAEDAGVLAGSLTDLSTLLASLDRGEEATGVMQESVALHRSLARNYPTSFTAGLAMTLTNLSFQLVAARRYGDAIVPIGEAISLYRLLANRNSAAHGPDLVKALHIFSAALSGLGKHAEAQAAIQEADRILDPPRGGA